MKKSVIFLVFTGWFAVLSQLVTAQEETVPGKLFFVELGGPGVIMSANFDARLKPKERLGFGYRLGAGFTVGRFYDQEVVDDVTGNVFYEKVTRSVYTFPIGVNYILGSPHRRSTFEVGAGISLLSRRISLYNYEKEKEGNVLGYLTFMYRLTPLHSGISFRAGFTPIIGTAGDLYPMVAIAFGYAF